MTEIIGKPEWSPVRLLEENEFASGGEEGNMNEQAKSLANRTEYLNEEKANKEDIVQGQFSFTTMASFDAKKATLPLNCTVIIDEAGPNQGSNTWNGIELKKSSYDPASIAQKFTKDSILNSDKHNFEVVKTIKDGGSLYYSKANNYLFSGFITPEGVFTSSTAGYKTTDFIAIYPGKKFKYSLNASSNVAAISYWDENKLFISVVVSNNNTAEVEVTPPANAKFIRSSSNLSVTPNAYIYTSFDSILNDPSLIRKDSFTLKESVNLAKPSYIVNDSYVTNVGSIAFKAGWKYIKIPVVPGETYTFGRFVIDTAGYYAFYTASNTLIENQFGTYQSNTLPKTVVAPENAAYLLIDIARDNNTPGQHEQLTVNIGSTLIDYVDPRDTIVAIADYQIAGTSPEGEPNPPSGNYVEQGKNATIADLIADSIRAGALFANLPTADDPTLEIEQVYEDENGFLKVKR